LHRLPPQQSGLQAFYGIASGMARPSQNHAKVADTSSFESTAADLPLAATGLRLTGKIVHAA
jgi:hypothetical protein